VIVATADQTLHRKNRAFRIGDGLPLRRLTDQTLALVRESDDRRRCAHAFSVLDDPRRLAFHHSDAGIGRSEIDTDDLGHGLKSPSLRQVGLARQAPKVRPPYPRIAPAVQNGLREAISLGSYR